MIARWHRRKCSRCGKIYVESMSPQQRDDPLYWRSMGVCPSCRLKAGGKIIKDVAKAIKRGLDKRGR